MTPTTATISLLSTTAGSPCTPVRVPRGCSSCWSRALTAIARALQPGGILAFDICDLSWGTARRDALGQGRIGPDWAVITEFTTPSPTRFVRDITTFLPNADGSWRRAFEHHENTLIGTSRLPHRLARLGITAQIHPAFGDETLRDGLHVVIGKREL